MWKSLRGIFEKLAYAGLKPRGVDPLYLSNRSFGQKLKAWAVFGVPAAVVLSVLAFVLFRPHLADGPLAPPEASSNGENTVKLLPDLKEDLHIDAQRALDIEGVHVISDPARLAGVAKNNSDREIATAELVFDLTDKAGSRLGAVSTEVKSIAAKSSVPFTFPIEQAHAAFAIVREVHVH